MSKTMREFVYTMVGAIAGIILGLALTMIDLAGSTDPHDTASLLGASMSFVAWMIARQHNKKLAR